MSLDPPFVDEPLAPVARHGSDGGASRASGESAMSAVSLVRSEPGRDTWDERVAGIGWDERVILLVTSDLFAGMMKPRHMAEAPIEFTRTE